MMGRARSAFEPSIRQHARDHLEEYAEGWIPIIFHGAVVTTIILMGW